MVSKENLSKLKVIIKEEYGRDLSNSEVSELGNGLVNYFKALKRLKIAQLSQDRNKNQKYAESAKKDNAI